MKIVVLVIGIATAVRGCATKEVRDGQFSRARGASYNSPASALITVNPGQVCEN